MSKLLNFRSTLSFIKVGLSTSPARMIFQLLLSICEPLLQLASFFIPLKALVLLYSDGVPTYYPDVLQDVDKIYLVISLLFVAVLVYITHAGVGKFLLDSAGSIKQAVIRSYGVNGLFTAERDFILRYITRGVSASSSLVFCLILFAAALLYDAVVAGLMLVGFVSGLAISLTLTKGDQVNDRVVYLSTVSFLIFVCGVVAYIYGYSKLGLLETIIFVYMSRQLFQRSKQLIVDADYVKREHSRYESIVSQSENYMDSDAGKLGIWLGLDERSFFAQCESLKGISFKNLSLIDYPGVGVSAYLLTSECDREYLVKIFSKVTLPTLEEEEFLYENSTEHYSPFFKILEIIKGDDVLVVYDLEGFKRVSGRVYEEDSIRLRESLACYTPPEVVVSKYMVCKRSYISDFGQVKVFDQLIVSCNSKEEVEKIEWVSKYEEDIKKIINDFPLVLNNVEWQKENIFTYNGNIRLISWAGWQVIPFGCDLPLVSMDYDEVVSYIKTVGEQREDVRSLSVEQVRLVNYIYLLMLNLSRDNRRKSIQIIERIYDLINSNMKVITLSSSGV